MGGWWIDPPDAVGPLRLVGCLANFRCRRRSTFRFAEWLLLQAFLYLRACKQYINMLCRSPAAVIALAAALAAYVMVKFYGVIFLGQFTLKTRHVAARFENGPNEPLAASFEERPNELLCGKFENGQKYLNMRTMQNRWNAPHELAGAGLCAARLAPVLVGAADRPCISVCSAPAPGSGQLRQLNWMFLAPVDTDTRKLQPGLISCGSAARDAVTAGWYTGFITEGCAEVAAWTVDILSKLRVCRIRQGFRSADQRIFEPFFQDRKRAAHRVRCTCRNIRGAAKIVCGSCCICDQTPDRKAVRLVSRLQRRTHSLYLTYTFVTSSSC